MSAISLLRLVIVGLGMLTPHLAHAAFDSADMPTDGPLTIMRITPEGDDVVPARQIVIEFNRPVVEIGRMERDTAELPITLKPELKCQWRWISTRNLACNLDEKEAMVPATAYEVAIEPGIRTLDGVTIDGSVKHGFVTRRPAIQGSDFRVWLSPVMPVIRVYWDQPVSKQSVMEHLYFTNNANNRTAVTVEPDRQQRKLPLWLRLPGEKTLLETAMAQDDQNAPPVMMNGQEYRRVWIIRPQQNLGAGEDVALKVEPGIAPSEGTMPGIEERTVEGFRTFKDFAFIGVGCTSNNGQEILVKPDTPQTPDQYCNPQKPVTLKFTTPVARRSLRDFALFEPKIGNGASDGDKGPWGEVSNERTIVDYPNRASDGGHSVWLPMGLKPAAAYHLVIKGTPQGFWQKLQQRFLPNNDDARLQDNFGNMLAQDVVIDFHTDHRVPNYVLDYQAAVLEKQIDSEVPLYVNNLEKIDWNYRTLTAAGAKADQRFSINIPKVQDIQFAIPSRIRDMLGGQSGAFYGSFSTTPAVQNSWMNTRLFAAITPWQVHVKLGHFNSIAWVTDLADGKPVADATVTIYRDAVPLLAGPKDASNQDKTGNDGVAQLPGMQELDPRLSLVQAWNEEAERLFVQVRKGNDLAVLPLWDPFRIDGWRSSGTSFYPDNRRKFGHIVTWGTTAQGIYHPGDTIQYKFQVRNQDNKRLVPPPRTGYWLELVDPTGKVVTKVENISLSEFGGASGEIALQEKAITGWYDFRLNARFSKANLAKDDPACAEDAETSESEGEEGPSCPGKPEFTWTPMRVLVSDFTPAPFQVSTVLEGELFHDGDAVAVQSGAKLHSGGPYTQASARVTAILREQPFISKHPLASQFSFGVYKPDLAEEQVFQDSQPLDSNGERRTTIPVSVQEIPYGTLAVETAVQDDRGKNVARQATATYVGVDRFVGVRLKGWFYPAKQDIPVEYLVVDEHGKPVAGAKVALKLQRTVRDGARVKGPGNAYLSEEEERIVTEAECAGVSSLDAAICAMHPEHAGQYTLTAEVRDTKDRVYTTAQSLWVSGRDYVYWDDGNDNALEVMPEKDSWKIGDKARFIVKNPWPGAQALVTVERYGILDHFVMPLTDSVAVIEIPVKPDYMPGFYLSVQVMSPRVDKPLEAGQVDLGKPAFRIGYARVAVRDSWKEIAVTATSDKPVYRPGETVTLSLQAKTRQPMNQPVELAVAVLDEAVFDLIAKGRSYYDPYEGFYHFDSLDLINYNLLTRLVGRQKFEKKGANPGGDGGVSIDMRSVFKYVSYWNPAIRTDAAGKAQLRFTLPDNLTGWRVLAMAATPGDRFGLGEANFKVNQPTEIRPVMPNQVAETDQFDARFSVMNRTDRERRIEVTITASGDIDAKAVPHTETTLNLKPWQRGIVTLPLKAIRLPEEAEKPKGTIHFNVTAGDDSDRDGVIHDLPVLKMRSLDVGANYGTTESDRVEEQLRVPADSLPDTGDVRVTFSPSVIGNLEGAFRYIRDYPYICWEQVLTRGVMAAHFKNLRPWLSAAMRWDGHEALPEQTLARAANYQAPNGGMAYFIATDERADPYLSAYSALAFNWLRNSGYKVPEQVSDKLDDYLLNLLRRDEIPDFYSEGMASSVRAVALAALAERQKVTADDISRYSAFLPQMSLFGKAHLARAAMSIDGQQQQAITAFKAIMSHASETGGKIAFNEDLDDGYRRILATPMRDNCAILDLVTMMGERDWGRTVASDLPFKMVRAITQTRGNRDHWENTQENMFCLNALTTYSRAYEKTTPAMKVTAAYDGKPMGQASFSAFRDPPVVLKQPLRAADIGQQAALVITRNGEGRLYYVTHMRYALREAAAADTNAGIEVHREYSIQKGGAWQLLNSPMQIAQGDLVRVDLYLSLPTARNFVVVDDPVPGGLETVNTDLANNSVVDAAAADFVAAKGAMWLRYNDWVSYNAMFWSFYHRELRHDAARFYADYLPPGNYHLSYMTQAIASGDFTIMPTMAAEMYDPDVYGKTVMRQLRIVPKP